MFISSPHSTQTGSRALAIHGFSSQIRNRCLLASVHFVFWALLLLVLMDYVDSSSLLIFSSLLSSLRIGLIFTLALCSPDLSRSFSYGALPLPAPYSYYAPTINTYNALNPAPSGVARLQNVQEGINLQADLIALEDIYAKANLGCR